jgi:hypothetical protein
MDKNGKEVKYNKVNVSDENGNLLELAVHKDLDREKSKTFKMGTDVVLAYKPDTKGQIRVVDINKA